MNEILDAIKFIIDIVVSTVKSVLEFPKLVVDFIVSVFEFIPSPFNGGFMFICLFAIALFIYKLVRWFMEIFNLIVESLIKFLDFVLSLEILGISLYSIFLFGIIIVLILKLIFILTSKEEN